jgi:large subunit ribosomal protein L19
MSQALLHTQAAKYKRAIPDLRPGYTVRVHQKVQEGEKERVQIFEGLVVSMHKGKCATDATVTVRRIVEGVGVEKIFSLCSPSIKKIDVVKVARIRRAKLFFLRGRRGKSARLSERFTTAEEFNVAVAEDEPAASTEESSDEAAPEKAEDQKEEKKEEKASKKEEKADGKEKKESKEKKK